MRLSVFHSSHQHRRRGVVLQSNIVLTVLLLLLSLLTGAFASPEDLGSGPGEQEQGNPEAGQDWTGQKPLRGKTVVIDPGHGGADPGAVASNANNANTEAENVLAIAYELKGMLEYAGAEVIMTRSGDYLPGGSKDRQLTARVRTANEAGADVFVSIHNDWFTNPQVHGTHTFYYSPTGSTLAQAIQDSLVRELGSKDLGIKYGNFYVLRRTVMPAVLVEVGFLSNPREGHLLSTSAYQLQAARGIYHGIARYFGITLPLGQG